MGSHDTMESLRALLLSDPAGGLTVGGLLIGTIFGYVAARSSFCVMGAVSDWRAAASSGRLGAVALAMAVAIVGTQALNAAGLTDLSRSMYLAPRISWLGAILGGLLFGIGMVFAGGCASRNLVRAGAGDLRSLIVLMVMSVAALAALSGVLALLRSRFEDATAINSNDLSMALPSLAALLAKLGFPAGAGLAAAALVAGPLLAFAFGIAGLTRDLRNLLGGLGVGALVVAGWLLTGLAFDEMAVHPVSPSSLSFVKPVADTVDWLERATALGLPGFGSASVIGTLLGSAIATVMAGHWRIIGFADTSDLMRHIAGALAMGVGGVLALGCSIGQGLTGLSTLGIQSLIAITAIFVGTYIGLNLLERRI